MALFGTAKHQKRVAYTSTQLECRLHDLPPCSSYFHILRWWRSANTRSMRAVWWDYFHIPNAIPNNASGLVGLFPHSQRDPKQGHKGLVNARLPECQYVHNSTTYKLHQSLALFGSP